MRGQSYILAIDQGTTSTRAVIFDRFANAIAKAQQDFPQSFPASGWVEHDAEVIWQSVLSVFQQVMKVAQVNIHQIAAVGITNQRETTVIWDKKTGVPIYPAIVWQDRRTADYCEQLKKENPALEKTIHEATGLLLDPYFSSTKLHWLLTQVPQVRARADRGELAFGTMDSYLLYRFTKGRHATDITNASRTMLFNINTLNWDDNLLKLFNIPRCLLPEVLPNCASFGEIHPDYFGRAIPITGMAGDQQAAAIGQACFQAGMMKSTYGTGCFVLLNTGEVIKRSKHRLLTTIASQINGKTQYAMEGSIFIAGAAVKWVCEKLSLIAFPRDSEVMAASLKSNGGVYLVPAFTGLGAPYWRPEVRGLLTGLTRDTGRAEIVRAVLESVAYQSVDLLQAFQQDGEERISIVRVDGGMVENNWLMQFLADMLQLTIERPTTIETTVRGAAFLAGLHIGYYESLEKLTTLCQQEACFVPRMLEEKRNMLYQEWQVAVMQACTSNRTNIEGGGYA